MSLSGPFFIHMGFDMYSHHFLSHFHYETKFSHVRHTYFFQSAVNVYILLKQATFNTKGSQMLNVFPTFQHNSSTPSICLHQDIRAVNCISCLKSCFLFTSYISPNSEKVQSLFLHILPGPGGGGCILSSSGGFADGVMVIGTKNGISKPSLNSSRGCYIYIILILI